MSDPSWQLHPNVHPMTVGTLLDSVMDLGSAAEGLLDKKSLFDTDGGWRVLQAVVRQISVPLRKLCLDGEGALLKKTIASPTFYPHDTAGPIDFLPGKAEPWMRSRRRAGCPVPPPARG